jgi:hypothetical protein
MSLRTQDLHPYSSQYFPLRLRYPDPSRQGLVNLRRTVLGFTSGTDLSPFAYLVLWGTAYKRYMT